MNERLQRTRRPGKEQGRKNSRGPKQQHDQSKKRASRDDQGEKKRRADRAYYRRHRKRLRAYDKARSKRPEFRERLLAYRGEYHERHYARITAAELKLLQDDPAKRFRMARPDRGQKITLLTTELTDKDIVCLECRVILGTLGQHLRVHGLSPKEYRQRWGYNRKSALCSVRYSRKMSKTKKTSGLVPPPERRFVRGAPPSHRGRKGTRLEGIESFRAKMKGRGRPDRWRVPDEEIARLALQEKSLQQIAGQVHLEPSTVRLRLRRIGFPPFQAGPYQFRHGELVAIRDLRDACEDFELKPLELARRMRIDTGDLYRRLKHYREDSPLTLMWAQKLEQVRKRLRRERSQQPASSRGGRPRSLLPSEEKRIPRKYHQLQHDLSRLLRRWREESSGKVSKQALERVLGWLCAQRRAGRIGVLLFMSEFFSWMEKTFRVGYYLEEQALISSKRLALQFLAASYGVSPDTISRIVWPRRANHIG